MFSPDISEQTLTNQEETTAATIKKEQETSEEAEEAEAKLVSPPEARKSVYHLADTGLWWDSFEEEPQFELEEDFESQLTLSEEEDWTGLGTKTKKEEEEENDHLRPDQ